MRMLAVLPRAGRNVGVLSDVWAQVVLAQVAVSSGLLEHFRPGPVTALAGYDAEHGTSLLLSLRQYLDDFGDMARAAKRLHIHVNSLCYRLRRIVDVTEIDLDDPAVRLAIGLQRRLDDTLPEAARSCPNAAATRQLRRSRAVARLGWYPLDEYESPRSRRWSAGPRPRGFCIRGWR